jgi:hypothetical protein
VALLILIVIIALYYVPHKPFDNSIFSSIFEAIKDLLIALSIIALAGGMGKRVLGEFHSNRIANLILQAAFGLGIASLLLLGLGLLGLFQTWFFISFLLISILVFWKSIRDWLLAWKAVSKEFRESSRLPRILAIICISLLLMQLLESLAPPFHFDALVYHLSLPEAFLDAGRFVFTAENPYWGMPLSSELLYTWVMALGRSQTAAVLGWGIGVLALIGVIGLGKNISPRAGWVAAAALLAGETISSSLGWAYADWGAALQGIGMLIALDAWRQDDSQGNLMVAGLMAGFGFGFKYTAAILIPAGWAFVIHSHKRTRFLPSLTTFTVSAGFICLLWFIKNVLFTSSPLYPFIGNPEWVDPMRTAFFRGTVSPWPILTIALTPFAATLLGVEGAPGFSASIGPLLIGLSVGVLLVRNSKRSFIHGVGLFVLVGWCVWACATLSNSFLGQSRLYYALFPAWGLLAGAGFEGFAQIKVSNIRFERIVGVLVVVSLSFSAFTNLQDRLRKRPLPVIVGIEEEASYLTRALGAYYPAMQAIHNLPEDSAVLNLWEPRGFYCRPRCRADTWIDRWYLDRQRYGEVEKILHQWQVDGFTHVLLHDAGMQFVMQNDKRYQKDDWETLASLLDRMSVLDQFGDGYSLYGLTQ